MSSAAEPHAELDGVLGQVALAQNNIPSFRATFFADWTIEMLGCGDVQGFWGGFDCGRAPAVNVVFFCEGQGATTFLL